MGSAWPEKVAIGAAALISIAMLLFWAVLADGVRSTLDTRLNIAVFWWFVKIEIALVPPLWLLSRAIYLVTHNWHHWRSR